jgi:hypothetical protein
MPVADIKAVLAAPDAPARNALIAAHLNRLEAELAQTRTAVESLRKLLQPPDGPAAIEHRSVPATAAAAIGAVVDRADALAWWQGALGELRATIRAQLEGGTVFGLTAALCPSDVSVEGDTLVKIDYSEPAAHLAARPLRTRNANEA